MQLGYINGIINRLIDIFVRMPNFKCSMLQEQNRQLFYNKKLRKKVC